MPKLSNAPTWSVFSPICVIYRLVGARLLAQNDKRPLLRRYMTLETFAEVGDNPALRLLTVKV